MEPYAKWSFIVFEELKNSVLLLLQETNMATPEGATKGSTGEGYRLKVLLAFSLCSWIQFNDRHKLLLPSFRLVKKNVQELGI